jgi:hypothetical protein
MNGNKHPPRGLEASCIHDEQAIGSDRLEWPSRGGSIGVYVDVRVSAVL